MCLFYFFYAHCAFILPLFVLLSGEFRYLKLSDCSVFFFLTYPKLLEGHVLHILQLFFDKMLLAWFHNLGNLTFLKVISNFNFKI